MAAKPNPQRDPDEPRQPRATRSSRSSEANDFQVPATQTPAHAASQPGGAFPATLGKFTLVRKLGQGGMGAVYLASDNTLKRSVALKVLSREKADNPTLKKRFQAEAQAAASLKHENIVSIFETGEIDGQLYLALEFVDGTDASNLVLRRGTLPVKRSIDVVRQVALALRHAATQRLVHRDIKPGNILIRRDGVVKLADLGLARTIDAHIDTSLTRSGTTVGTVDYISPEQARSSKLADERSDLYSLGCTWYFLLTGEPPFSDGDVTNKLQAHATRPFPNPRDKNPQVPEGLTAVMRRLTEKDPARRYQSATELLEDLDVIQHGGEQLSRAILQEESNEPDSGDVEALPDSDHPRSKTRPVRQVTARDLPRTDRKPLLPEQAPQGSELANTLKKYGVLGSAVAAAIAAVIWLATQLAGGGGEGGEQNLGKELANAARREVKETRIGGQAGSGTPSAAPAVGAGDPAANNRQIGEAGGLPSDTVPGQTLPPGEMAGGNQRLGGNEPGTIGGAAGGAGPRAKGDLAAVPGWVTQVLGGTTGEGGLRGAGAIGAAGGTSRKTMIVDVRKGGGETQTSLNAALRAVTQAGARIELRGPGPYVLKADTLRNAGRVSLVASDPSEMPLVVLQPPDAGAVHAFLTCVNTSLELEGVHLAADVTGYQTQPADALIHVVGGDLSVRQSSLSARGLPATGMCAVRFGGSIPGEPAGDQGAAGSTTAPPTGPSPGVGQGGVVRSGPPAGLVVGGPAGDPSQAVDDLDSGPKLLLQRSVIRGANLTAIRCEAEQASVVVLDSLLVSGLSPAVQCLPGELSRGAAVDPARGAATAETSRPGGTSTSQSPGSPPTGVQLTLAGATLVSDSTACEWTLPKGEQSAGASRMGEWVIHNSLVTTRGGDQPTPEQLPVLLRVLGVSGELAASLGPDGRLQCRVQNSILAGWSGLVGPDPATAESPWVRTVGEWSTLFHATGVSERNFPQQGWPAESGGNVWQAPLSGWNRETARSYRVEAAGGGLPGCDVTRLSLAGLGALDVVQVLSARPTTPDRLTGWGGVTQTLTVDVTREDLGQVLAGRSLAAGTTVLVRGAGVCGSSPVVLQNKRVRLVFEQAPGRPLVLTPKAGGNVSQPLFVVEGGVLRLERGAIFGTAPGSRNPLPPWLILARDADVVITGCRLQGLANQSESPGAGLIRMERTGKASQMHWLHVTDSLLLGGARGVDADARQTVLQFENSLLCVTGTALSLTIAAGDTRIAGVVDLRHCTFSAGETYVRVTPGELARPAIDPLQIFVDRCVFGPSVPAGGGPGQTTLLEMGPTGWDGGQVQWWENSSGYATDVGIFARVTGAPGGLDNSLEDWQRRWGAERCRAMLTGVGGVVMKRELPARWIDLVRVEVGAFELLVNSRAASWDGGAAAIGARVEQLRLPSTELTAPAASVNGPGPGVAPRQPGF